MLGKIATGFLVEEFRAGRSFKGMKFLPIINMKGGGTMAKDEYGLTPKQRAFCDYYIANHGNATQAAKAAGYKGSYKTLDAMARENLEKPRIVAYLDIISKEAAAKRLVGKDEALEILSGMARGQKDPDSEDEVPYSVRTKAAELEETING